MATSKTTKASEGGEQGAKPATVTDPDTTTDPEQPTAPDPRVEGQPGQRGPDVDQPAQDDQPHGKEDWPVTHGPDPRKQNYGDF